MLQYHGCPTPIEWRGCYRSDGKYKKFITAESYAHPAKASFHLLEKIYAHLSNLNLLKPDDVIIDYMSGSGRTNTIASLHGHRSIAVELEPHFIDMIAGYECDGRTIVRRIEKRVDPSVKEFPIVEKYKCGLETVHEAHHVEGNREKLERELGRKVDMEILQADARQLSSILGEGGVGIVSPPYGEQNQGQLTTIGRANEPSNVDSQRIASLIHETRLARGLSSNDLAKHFLSKTGGITGIVWNWEHMKSMPTAEEWSILREVLEIKDDYLDDLLLNLFSRPAVSDTRRVRGRELIGLNYSSNPTNIGNLKDKKVGIVSPPYSNRLSDDDQREFMDKDGQYKRPNTSYSAKRVGITSPPYSDVMADEGHDPERDRVYKEKGIVRHNYQRRVGIMSPPYATMDAPRHDDPESYRKYGPNMYRSNQRPMPDNPTNIGNLKDTPRRVGITSPPYIGQLVNEGGNQEINQVKNRPHPYIADKEDRTQIGNYSRSEGESYLSAMAQVYQESFKSGISPLVVITKNPTREGKLRRLDLDTARLLENAGYEIFDYHRAILWEQREQMTLDMQVKRDYKGRLSFFKRLSIQKGNVAANFEDIIFASIPEAPAQVVQLVLDDFYTLETY